MRFPVKSVAVTCLTASLASAQNWNPNKVYYAGAPGQPSTLRYINDNLVDFPGWRVSETSGTILVNDPPSQRPDGIGGLMGNFVRISGTAGAKEKHLTNKTGTGHDWTFSDAADTRTALFWRLYVPASPSIDKGPTIHIRTHNWRHVLDFKPNAGGACADGGGPPRSGWVAADGAAINAGGWPSADGKLYLPMSMDAWHTLRVEVNANGAFEAWVDEENGYSDVNHITAAAGSTGTGGYIEIGRRTSESGTVDTQYWTNYLAWGQDVTGPTSEITDRPAGQIEQCYNGIDDDGDGLTDCADPACPCVLVSENTAAACSNARDDDGDGLKDCDDPDCAAQALCGENAPEYIVTLVRQVGDKQSSYDGPFGTEKIYFSVYDDMGNRLNNVTISDPCTGASATTGSDLEQNEAGHARYPITGGFPAQTYRFRVTNDPTYGAVATEATPDLVVNIGPHKPFYAWQVEFMRKSHRSDPVEAAAPAYKFDNVVLNTRPGPNPTVANDSFDVTGPGGVVWGQTFTVPQGINRIVSARAEMAIGFQTGTFQYRISVHEVLNNPPVNLNTDIGPAIGPARLSPPAILDGAWWAMNQVWPVSGSDSLPVEPGKVYFIKLTRTGANPTINAYRTLVDYYPGGQAFRSADGVTLVQEPYDLVAVLVGAAVGKICPNPAFDVTGQTVSGTPDGHVDGFDFAVFEACATGPAPSAAVWEALSEQCQCMDRNGDMAVDQADFGAFQRCFSGTDTLLLGCDVFNP